MSDLVRDHISLSEIAGRAELLFEVAIERQIDVDLLVAGAVERTCRASGRAARGLNLIRKKNEFRIAVLFTGLSQDSGPHVFGTGEHDRDKLPEFVFGGACRTRGSTVGRRLFISCLIENRSGINPEEHG